jgi:hypothetical protein
MAMRKLVVAILALLMAGCSSNPPAPAEKPKPKPPEALTGRAAFQKCFIAARGWARDAQLYRLESEITPEFNGHDGKASTWRAYFGSALQHGAKPYIWSNGEVSPGTEDTYSPTNTSTQVFDVAFLKTDSDQAVKAAQEHGGDKLLEKSPDTPIFYILDWDRSTNLLFWHVIYGTDRDNVKQRLAVNASTGDFVRVEK